MDLVNTTLWHIETRMGEEDLSLTHLARDLGVSPYHLSRAFRARTGWSVMRYLRARRLSRAASAVAQGDDLLTVALDAGYASHEAFTRAFSDQFGAPPSQMRGALPSNLTEPLAMTESQKSIIPDPELRDGGGFSAIGIAREFTPETIPQIPALWAEFNARMGEVEAAGPRCFGVCYDKTSEARFRYMAGAEAAPGSAIPKGMEQTRVPAGRYAVFTFTGHLSDLPAFIGAIWDHGLTDAGLSPTDAPDFELYDDRMDPQTGSGTCEVWIPV
ncbi:MAG: AraC family transcriptional regulator [Rhodobacterales bacterium]|nr:MAG: AraC family transcriptional regulator [Rhodobacterales bacterium]